MMSLRERFVQARLCETPLFGQNDIEEWLARERVADQPHMPDEPAVPIVSQWQRLPGSDLLGLTDRQTAWEQLISNASSVCDFSVDQMAPKTGDWRPYGQLFGTHVDCAGIFVGYNTFVVIELGRRLYILRILAGFEHSIKQEGLVCRPFGIDMELTSRAVADVLLGEWSRNGLNAACAREVLCNAVERRVHEECVQAERDFDTAVAVSEDGTKIVHADYVVIVDRETDDGDLLFRAYFTAPFQQHKLRRPTFIDRVTIGGHSRFQSGSGLQDAAAIAREQCVLGDRSVRDPMCGWAWIITYICGGGDRQVRIYVAGESSVSADLRGNLGSGAVYSV